jgi:hypothetical protein
MVFLPEVPSDTENLAVIRDFAGIPGRAPGYWLRM